MSNCRKQKLERFRFFVLPNNFSGSVNLPISSSPANPTILASLEIPVELHDAIWLTGNVGWMADSGIANVLFKIWRGSPVTGTLIYSALQGGESGFERNYIASLSHIDVDECHSSCTTYFLTAEVINPPATATVIGPITFIAAAIEPH